MRDGVHGGVGNQQRLGVWMVVGICQLVDLARGKPAHLCRRVDARLAHRHNLNVVRGQKCDEQLGDIARIARSHRHFRNPERYGRVDEGEGGARRRRTAGLGQERHLMRGALRTVDKAARGARPHHSTRFMRAQQSSTLGEFLRTAQIEQFGHGMQIGAVDVHDGEVHVQLARHQGVVRLGRVIGVDESHRRTRITHSNLLRRHRGATYRAPSWEDSSGPDRPRWSVG